EDDQAYFPRYNLSGVIQEELYEQYPQIEELIDPLSEHLDNETMAELNARVDVDGEETDDDAWDYLVEEGFITEERLIISASDGAYVTVTVDPSDRTLSLVQPACRRRHAHQRRAHARP